MPDDRDEFGGVAVDDSDADEFGGVPISEDSGDHTPEAALARFGKTIPQPSGAIYGMPILGDEIVDPTSPIPPIRRGGQSVDTFEALKPSPREVQNAYDVMKAYGGRVGFAGMMPTSAEQMQEELAEPDQPISPGAKIASGVIGGGINLAKTFTTPEGIGLMALGGIPGIAGRVISLGFLADMLHQAPAVYRRLGDAFGRNDLRDEAEALFDAIVHGGFTAGTAHGAFRGASPSAVREWANEFVTKTPREERAKIYGTENVQPEAAPTAEPAVEPAAAPETQLQTFVGDKPVEVLEINKKKKTALVQDANDPNAPPDVVKLSDLEEREVEKGGEKENASEVGETAKVYGDVRAQPGEGTGEVPVQESSGGIQPQADRGVQPAAEGQNREVSLTPEQVKENTIKERIKEGIDPENIQVIVNKPGGDELPQANYVQVDDVTPGKNNPFSSNPEQLNSLGLKMPTKEQLLKLPQGKYTLSEVQEMLQARETLPLSEFKGEPPANGVPIKVQRPDGSTYEAWLVAAPGSKKAGTRIAKVKAETGGITDGILGKGDKIIEGPKTAEEYAAAKPVQKAQEVVTKVAQREGSFAGIKRSAKSIKEELVGRIQQAIQDFEAGIAVEESTPTVEINIPGDGKFSIKNNRKALDAALKAAQRLNTASKGPARMGTPTAPNRVKPSDRISFGTTDAITLYGSPEEAYRRLKSQLDRSEELELEPQQVQDLAQVVERLKNMIEQPLESARRKVADAEDRLKFLTKEFGPKHKSVVNLQENLKTYRNELEAAKIKRDEVLAEKPALGTIADVPAFAGIGITPPGLGAIASLVRKTLTSLNRTRLALGTIWKGRANRESMDQTIDAADNKANIVGQRMGNRLRIGTGRMERMATMAVIEANGDPAKLNDFLRQALAGGNTEAVDAVRYAQRNWANLQTAARRARRILDWQISSEQNAGISTEYRDAYVPHIYDRDLLMGSGRPFVIAGGTGTGSGFKKGRTFETIFDAIEAGYTPKTLDVSDLVEHRIKVGQKIINRKLWAESLQSLIDPSDGKPLAAPLIRKSRGPGKPSYEVAPPGYRPVEILPGVRTAVHEAYLPLFNALTGESFISGSVPGKIALEVAGGIKHGLLIFDSFHASRIFQKLLSLAPGKVLSGKAGYKRGTSLLEYSDGDLSRAVRERLITQDVADWVRTNRADSNLLIDSGLNVGRIQEGLYNSVVRQIPGLGAFNKWVFEKLTRGALMEAGLIELERVSAAKPGVPRGTIAREVARNLNAYFGNLGRQGVFKSKSAQDIARLLALAPQWVESMARTELKGAAQAAKGVTYDPVVHKTLFVGSIGKGVAQGLLAYFVGTQILNYITRGHSTFENEEENHKLDAWIPGTKGSNGFFLSPFSVVAELTHDMLRYSSKEPTKLEAAMRIANNKASPMFRAGKVLMTGRDYDGKQITDTWNRVKAAGIALAPTPIPAAPLIKGSSYPGQMERQILGSAGLKVEPAESAAQRIAHKAKTFMEARGKKPVGMELTDEPAYYKLRDFLRKDDDKSARDMLEELRKIHTPKQIMLAMRNHVRRPFTGARKDEVAFRQSLSDKERALYDRARDEQRDEYQKFLKIWYKGGE